LGTRALAEFDTEGGWSSMSLENTNLSVALPDFVSLIVLIHLIIIKSNFKGPSLENQLERQYLKQFFNNILGCVK
jgi:hypothetical protein